MTPPRRAGYPETTACYSPASPESIAPYQPAYFLPAASGFFQLRLGALVTSPFLIALAATRTYRTSPSITALTRCRFGMNRRFVIAVTCVPMPPFFLALPLRQIMLPLIGPLPVNSQNRDIRIFLREGAQNLP